MNKNALIDGFSLDSLSPWRKDFPETLAQLEEWQRDAAERRKRLRQESLLLSIGIIGQVKAGKSTFLNTLLFDGKPILPEAATPKTANLTRIRYGEKAAFTARFYTRQDWDAIVRRAKSDVGRQIKEPPRVAAGQSARSAVGESSYPDRRASGHRAMLPHDRAAEHSSHFDDDYTRVCKELVRDAARCGEPVEEILARGSIRCEAATVDELLGQLNDYVGSDGRYTPLVAETELELPVEALRDIEIVDTPGMNDPVLSRTDKTREYMAKCDVVFFLSRASQFLDETDQLLLTAQLPQKGVKRMVLVASQFDAVILDDGWDRKSYTECITRLQKKLTERALATLEAFISRCRVTGHEQLAEQLQRLATPYFVSSHAALIAQLPAEDLPPSVQHTLKEIEYLANNRWSMTFTKKEWQDIAGFESVRAALEESRAEKEVILAEQRRDLEAHLQDHLLHLLESLHDQAQERIHTLSHIDKPQLEEQAKIKRAAMERIHTVLAKTLQERIAMVEEKTNAVIDDIRNASKMADRLEERTGYKKERYSIEVSDAVWYKPWTWFSSHKENRTRTVSYTYIDTNDAIENLRHYSEAVRNQILRAFDDVSPKVISAELRRALVGEIDQLSLTNPKEMRVLVESVLDGLRLPALAFDAPDAAQLFGSFSEEVTSLSDQKKLHTVLEEAIRQIENDAIERLEKTKDAFSHKLQSIAQELHGALTKRLADELDRIEADLAEKEKKIAHYENLLGTIKPMLGK